MADRQAKRFAILRAGPGDTGERLDVFLTLRFKRSRTVIRRSLAGDVIDSAGRPIKWSHRLRQGEIVRVATIERPEPDVEVSYRLLYRDDWIVVVDKGAGAPVHPTRSYRTRTLLTRLRKDLADDGINPAHRLDRETSGVLIFGRRARAIKELMRAFRERRVEKRYLAVVRGSVGFDRLRVAEPLGRDGDYPIDCRMKVDRQNGSPAVTDLEVLDRRVDRSLVAANPRSGRQHQIRVHLAFLGHPILGDKLYQQDGQPYLAMVHGKLDADALDRLGHTRQALHAQAIEFDHPENGQRMHLTAPLPADLQELLDQRA